GVQLLLTGGIHMKISGIGSLGISIAFLASSAFASSINVVASSTGCFSTTAGACVAGTSTASEGGLTFTGQNPISGITIFDPLIGAFDLSNQKFNYIGTF